MLSLWTVDCSYPFSTPQTCQTLPRPRDITWHEDNWDNPDSRFLAWTLHDSKEGGAGDVYIAFNAHGFQV